MLIFFSLQIFLFSHNIIMCKKSIAESLKDMLNNEAQPVHLMRWLRKLV